MADNGDTLQIEHEWIGSKLRVTARWNGNPAHIDIIDPTNANHRRRFIKRLKTKAPMADENNLDEELLRIADTPPSATLSAAPVEIDISQIVRPEQIITADVSGLAVSVVLSDGDRPAPQWQLYLRWIDGRRECRALTGAIDLPTDSKLWIHPPPGTPSMTTAPGWSAASRLAWLTGTVTSNPADLFRRLCEHIAYFIDLPTDTAPGITATLALWSILTYCFQAWGAVPYLFFGGPQSSGKSRVFEVLSRLVYRPLQSSNLTAPALFRTLNYRGGTLLFDEAERLRQPTPEVQEILSMLLAGYKRGGQATRLEAVGDTFRPVTFDVYGPKALACVAGLPSTLASRSITVTMFRAGLDSPKPQRRIDADRPGWQRLRDDLHALVLDHGPIWLELAQQSNVCPGGIGGRNYELWQPILALAAWIESHGAKGLLSLLQRHALDSIEKGKDDAIPDEDEVLLEIMAESLQRGQPPTPGEILNKAKERDPGTFERWIAASVSRRLKTYGLEVPKKSHGERRYRKVTTQMLARIQSNYGIDLAIVEKPTHPDPDSSTPIDPRATQQTSVS